MLFSSLGVGSNASMVAPAPVVDQYADAVTLLLKGDGTTTGSNNNSIIDTVSGSAATITSNMEQGPFSPYGNDWSYLNAASSNLLTPHIAALHLSGDFTIELWVKCAAGTSGMIICKGGGAGIAYASYEIGSDGTNIYFAASSTNTGYNIGSEGGTTGRIGAFVPNQWTHVAVTRHGNVYRGFINGILGYQQVLSVTPYDSTPRGLSIGGNYSTTWGTGTPTTTFPGAISNLRIVKGTALYTTNFTVPTAPLTAITGTSILTCMSNRHVDLSANAIAITPTGTGSIIRSSPRRPNQVFSKDTAATLGGSAFAPTTTSQFMFPDSSANAFGTGNFTIECWAYLTTATTNASQAFYMNYAGAFTTGSIYFGKHATYSGRVAVWLGSVSTAAALLSDPTLPPNNTWVHYALVRNGTSLVLYRNGVSVASTTLAAGQSVTGATTKNYVHISQPGYISDFRTSNTAVYTGAFTPPSSPMTVGANTKMLASCANANIIDTTGQQNFETIGNASISTSVKRFGSASISFPTTGGGHYVRDKNAYAGKLGNGDFTVEGWFYIISKGPDGAALFANYDTWGAGAFGIFAGHSAGNVNKYQVALNGAGFPNIQSTTDVIFNEWHHVAVVRKNGTVTLYINGIANGSVVSSATLDNVSANLNYSPDTANKYYYVGYADEFRITKGLARYSSSFSVPTAEFVTNETVDPYLDAVDVLLLGNGTAGKANTTILDSSTNALTISASGNTTQGSVTPFVGIGGSLYFDGTGDHLSFPNSDNFAFGTGSYTIEFFAKVPSSVGTDKHILGGRNAIGTMYVATGNGVDSTAGALKFVGSSVINSGTKLLADGTWHHIAIVRNGSSAVTLYIDGVSSGTGTDNTNYTINNGTWYVGGNDQNPSLNNLNGYISNLRVVKGTAVYTADFTVPTAQLTAVSGTAVLLLGQNAGIIDSVSRNNIETAGSAIISTDNSKYGIGSIKITGAGGYVSIQEPTNLACSPGAGDFTVEFWRYANNFTGVQTIFDKGYQSTNGLLIQTAGAGDGTLKVYVSGVALITESSSASTGQWYHYALVRNGSTITLYRDGVSVGSVVNGTNFSLAVPAYIGGTVNGGGNLSIDGYIDDFRFTKGVARYVATFTPPQSQLPTN